MAVYQDGKMLEFGATDASLDLQYWYSCHLIDNRIFQIKKFFTDCRMLLVDPVNHSFTS